MEYTLQCFAHSASKLIEFSEKRAPSARVSAIIKSIRASSFLLSENVEREREGGEEEMLKNLRLKIVARVYQRRRIIILLFMNNERAKVRSVGLR